MRRAFAIAIALGLAVAAGPGRALDLGDGKIRLRNETYDRAVGPGPATAGPPASALAPDDVGAWLVAFDGPADETLRDVIAGHGARIVGYVPSSSYLVRAPARSAEALRLEPAVVRVDRYRPAWKLSPDIGRVKLTSPARPGEENRLLLRLEVFDGDDPEEAAAAARRVGAEVIGVVDGEGVARVVVRAERSHLAGLARISEVEWIEEVPELRLRNDAVRWVIQSNVTDLTPLYDNGLLGEDQILGHIDGQIRLTSCYFDDPGQPVGPSHRKIVGDRSGGSTAGAGHGTHTAGTLAGDPEPINGTTANRGMAPKARISHTNYNDLQWLEWNGQPSNLNAFLMAAHQDGARIHSNSWGDDSQTSYTSLCRDIDKFTRNQEYDLVVFAVTNTGTLKSPENAKNVLAVGATYGAPSQDAFWSGGEGPTVDGRRKPEVFAPGRFTISAASTDDCGLATMSGTSMACPAVAGGAALVREYLERGYHPTGAPSALGEFLPTGALLKALVVNSAVDLTGIPNYPSDREGWGRILLDDALYFPGDTRRLWLQDVRHARGLQTGGTATHSIQVTDASEPLAVTMAFTDVPASLGAALTPVNDLDLEVEGPDGLFLGNEFDVVAGASRTGGSADPLNNLERVVVASPTPGLWTIRVRAADVPVRRQGYAVVANGAVAGPTHRVHPSPEGHSRNRAQTRLAPETYRLESLTPNPFRRTTTVRYALPEPTSVHVAVYDVNGRLVRSLLDRQVEAGEFRASWDGRDDAGRRAAPGIYFVRLRAPGVERTVKGVLLR